MGIPKDATPHQKSTPQYGSQVRKALELSCTACVTATSPQSLLSPEIAVYVVTRRGGGHVNPSTFLSYPSL